MAGQHSNEAENLTRSKITNAYEHIDDSETAGARKRVQLYARDTSGNPVQLTASDDGKLDISGAINATIDNVGIKNASDVRINPSTEEKQNSLITEIQNVKTNTKHWELNDWEETGNVTYLGKETSSGEWWVAKIDSSSGSMGHASVTTDGAYTTYADAWTNRATLTYSDFSSAF